MTKTCYIVGAGDFFASDFNLIKSATSDDCIIAADGGLATLLSYGIVPNVVIGDFDSCKKEFIDTLPTTTTIITLNPDKDVTDLDACVTHGMNSGYQHFTILGASGGRFDHTIANIQLMHRLANNGQKVQMYTKDNCLITLHNNEIHFSKQCKGVLSVFSLCDFSYGVTETGLKYTLENATLSNQFALGVSNELIGKKSLIKVNEGTLLIVFPRSCDFS